MKPHLLITLVFFAFIHRGWSDGGANVSGLPSHIKPPDSGLTLIADYDHATAGTVPVYLINRSGKNISLKSQDGDVYLKLEYQDPDGHWQRAQPHGYSWCGNSYFNPPLIHSDHFIIIKGYQPSQGQSAKVRFRLFGQQIELASNVGHGLVRLEDIHKAQNDAMAVNSGDFAFVESVARGKLVLHNTMDHMKDLRQVAIRQLGSGKFDRTNAEAVLRDIVALKEDPYGQLAQGALNGLLHQAEHPR